jgi:hypothetical protein
VRVHVTVTQSELEKYKRLAKRIISDDETVCLIGEYWIMMLKKCDYTVYAGYLVMVIDTKDVDIYDDEIVLLATKEVVQSPFMNNMLRPM